MVRFDQLKFYISFVLLFAISRAFADGSSGNSEKKPTLSSACSRELIALFSKREAPEFAEEFEAHLRQSIRDEDFTFASQWLIEARKQLKKWQGALNFQTKLQMDLAITQARADMKMNKILTTVRSELTEFRKLLLRSMDKDFEDVLKDSDRLSIYDLKLALVHPRYSKRAAQNLLQRIQGRKISSEEATRIFNAAEAGYLSIHPDETETLRFLDEVLNEGLSHQVDDLELAIQNKSWRIPSADYRRLQNVLKTKPMEPREARSFLSAIDWESMTRNLFLSAQLEPQYLKTYLVRAVYSENVEIQKNAIRFMTAVKRTYEVLAQGLPDSGIHNSSDFRYQTVLSLQKFDAGEVERQRSERSALLRLSAYASQKKWARLIGAAHEVHTFHIDIEKPNPYTRFPLLEQLEKDPSTAWVVEWIRFNLGLKQKDTALGKEFQKNKELISRLWRLGLHHTEDKKLKQELISTATWASLSSTPLSVRKRAIFAYYLLIKYTNSNETRQSALNAIQKVLIRVASGPLKNAFDILSSHIKEKDFSPSSLDLLDPWISDVMTFKAEE